jgi:hypothetical protein
MADIKFEVAFYEFGWFIQATKQAKGTVKIYGTDLVIAPLVELTAEDYRKFLRDNGGSSEPANYVTYFTNPAEANIVLSKIVELYEKAQKNPYNPLDMNMAGY